MGARKAYLEQIKELKASLRSAEKKLEAHVKEIAELKSTIIKEQPDKQVEVVDSAGDECPIEFCNAPKTYVLIPCGHGLCLLHMGRTRSNVCPICKTPFIKFKKIL